MKVKVLIAVVLVSFITGVMRSQNVSETKTVTKTSEKFLFADDLLIENVPYSLSCKEEDSSGSISYNFELKKDGKTEQFRMMNIQLVEKSITVLQLALISAIKKLDSTATVDSSKLKIIARDFLSSTNRAGIVKSDSAEVVGVINVNPAVIISKKLKLKDMDRKKVASIDTALIRHPRYRRRTYKIDSKLIQSPKFRRRAYIIDTAKLKIDKVEIKFEYAQIAGIKVTGHVADSEKNKIKANKEQGGKEPSLIVFQNRIPISYATKKDVSSDRRLSNKRLYEPNNDTLSWIKFSDVITNDYRFMLKTEDYSPVDQVIDIKPGTPGNVLKKTPVTNLLTAAVYTDLAGLNSLKPNGLVQFEISHRFYLNRKVIQCGNSYTYFGFVNSIRPKVTFSKIESNNKTLDIKGDSLPLYTEAINIYKHTSWSSGGEINGCYIGLPCIHSMIYINSGVYVLNVPMRIPVADTSLPFHDIKADENRMFSKIFLNLFPELYWVISPNSRFQVGYSVKYNWLKNISHDVLLVTDTKDSQTDITKHGWTSIITFKFLASLRLSSKSNNEMFFRSSFNYMPKDPSQSYFQAQLGYTFNIFDKNIEPPPLKPFEAF